MNHRISSDEPICMDAAREPRNRQRGTMSRPQRIVVCDYSGHPFQVQLSRELARRGHEVLHLYSSDFLTPHGLLRRQPDDAATVNIEGLSIGERHVRESFFKRRRQEKKFGYISAERILAARPDVVLSCNIPLDARTIMATVCRKHHISFVLWLQDIYSIAISHILTKRFGQVGKIIGMYYRSREKMVMDISASLVCICSDFIDTATAWGIPHEKCMLIPNWGPVSEIRVGVKDNSWSRLYNLHDKKVVLYSGTLGFKHQGGLMLKAAESLSDREDVIFVIVSEGAQVGELAASAKEQMLSNIMILPFQPYESYPNVLAAADVLVGFIDDEAGTYSVPSKVLSYLCSGRPIVLAAPLSNLASRTVIEAGAGLVVPADAPTAFGQALGGLLDDDDRRAAFGRNARNYAERHFDVRRIGDLFEAILMRAAEGKRSSSGTRRMGHMGRVGGMRWWLREASKRRRLTMAGVEPPGRRGGRGSGAR